MSARHLICLAALMTLVSMPATAGRVLRAEVTHEANRYTVQFSVLLAVEHSRLIRLLKAYDRMAEFSPTVTRSRRVDGGEGEKDARIELTLRPCVLVIFCRTLTKVSDVYIHDGGDGMTFVADPALSDFHEARETIKLNSVSAGDGTRVRFQYSAVLRPKFNVPAFVGPWLIKRRILRELEITTRNVEQAINPRERADEAPKLR